MRRAVLPPVGLVFGLVLGACAGPRDVSEVNTIVDPLATTYGDCLENAAGHYARTITDTRRVRVVARDICEKKRRAIESALFDEDVKPDQIREYLRGVEMGANRSIAVGIAKGQATAKKSK